MIALFEKLYNSYMLLLLNLESGHQLTNKNLNYIMELIHVIEFISNGHPSEQELLYIANMYENVEASLIRIKP